jgi:hypothetical protein
VSVVRFRPWAPAFRGFPERLARQRPDILDQ